MPKLTPSKLVDLRRMLIPLVGEGFTSEALKECKDIHEEFGGIEVSLSEVLEEFKIRHKEEIEVLEQIINSDDDSKSSDNKKEVDIMKDFWDKQEDPTEFHPFLKIKSAITYTLELIDNEAEPRPSVDSFGNDQYIFDVTLKAISPKKALEDQNSEGFPLYQIGRQYAFAVKKKGRSMTRFKEMWKNEGPVKTYTFKRTGKGFQTDFVYVKVD